MLLQLSNVSKHYGGNRALDGFSLDVHRGEVVIIMGPSGCGKSTALRCINLLTVPDSGHVYWHGRDVLRFSPAQLRNLRGRIGFVFQHSNLIRRLTALENVAFPLIMRGVSRDEALDRAATQLYRVGLRGCESRYPAGLSGGELQRVGIARALVLQPELMLWDEPTASLDPILVGEVLDVMEELVLAEKKSSEGGPAAREQTDEAPTTMVIVTHEVAFARRAATRVVLMEQGRVVEQGAPEKVFETPSSEIGRRYRRLLVA